MRNTFGALVVGLIGLAVPACGGGASEQAPAQPPPPPAPPAPPPAAVEPAPAPPPPAPKPSMSEMEQKTIKDYEAGFTDAKKVAADYGDGAILWTPGTPELKGRDAIQQFHQSFLDAFSNVKFGVSRVWAKGDVAAVEWVLTGTQAKEWMGVPATEKPMGLSGCSMLWFDQDGRITKDHRYMDLGTVLSQLGVSKQKARPIPALPASVDWHFAKGTPEEDKLVGWVKSLDATFEKKDVKGFLDAMTDDSIYDDMSAPATMKGKGAAKSFFESFTKAFPDLKMDATNAFAAEDFVVQEYALTGTQKAPLALGPGMTVPATKKTIDYHAMDVFEVKDGKMTRGWTYANGLELATQLGIAPKTPAKPEKGAAPKAGDKGAAPAAKGAADKGAVPATKGAGDKGTGAGTGATPHK